MSSSQPHESISRLDRSTGCGRENADRCPHPRTVTRPERVVLLLHLGMPESPDRRAVRKFQARVFGDPEAAPLPHGLRWASRLAAPPLAWRSAGQLAGEYGRIWTEKSSPLALIAGQQAAALESVLPQGVSVRYATRYGRPGIAEALREIEAQGIHEVVAIPMYPHNSATTTRTIAAELYSLVRKTGCNIDLAVRGTWFDDVGYINAQARLIHDYACAHRLTPADTRLVYSLRSLPLAQIDRGDPYMDQVHRTAELVSRRLGWPEHRTSLGFQGPSGSKRRLQPAIPELLTELAESGQRQLLLCPISYTTDCLETLGDIHVSYRRQFEEAGRRFHVCPALNTYEPFIAALRNIALHGRHPVSLQLAAEGLMTDQPNQAAPAEDRPAGPPSPAVIDSLVMVGMTIGGKLGHGSGPAVAHAESRTFRRAKRTQCEVPEMLRRICGRDEIREAWLWNTCRRFEFFGLLNGVVDEARRAQVIDEVQTQLFSLNGDAADSALNVLVGADAWHYLMRTAAGLNSGLPGEREILRQLESAHRLAERAGTAGPLTARLLTDIAQREDDLRRQTEWGRFHPDYCYASISQIARSFGLKLHNYRCVVLGGSTTSCGILEALADRFDVPRRKMTLLHRGHGPSGGRLKMLRRAIGNGRRIRVHKYDERLVMDTIAKADILFIGLDRREPVLDGDRLGQCRDFTSWPLVVIDFNLFGSTVGLEDIPGVRLVNAQMLEEAADAFADEMCTGDEFAHAAEAADSWINQHLPHGLAPRTCNAAVQ